MPATVRPAAFRKTEPRPFAGFSSCALALAIVIETALATAPHIDFIERYGTNQVTIHFDTDANRTYSLQYCSGVNSGIWSEIYTVPAFPFPNHYVLLVSATNVCGFYRLAVTP